MAERWAELLVQLRVREESLYEQGGRGYEENSHSDG